MKTLLCTLAIAGSLLAVNPAEAKTVSHHHDSCDISLNYDVTAKPQLLSVAEDSVERYRIEGDKLFVDGKQVKLNNEQRELVAQYRQGVTEQLPKIIGLVDDAMDIASDAVGNALKPLLGEEGTSKLNQSLENLHTRLNDLAYHRGDVYYVGASEKSLDAAFNDEFSEEIEQVVMSSMGSILMNIGKSMMNGDTEALGAKLDRMGEEIEARVDAKSKVLERHADELCQSFEQLQVTEQQLQQQIPELAKYTLIAGASNKQ
ncbi:YggN family protein [Shewanella sp. C32]|uniref:YggN family protein n=1 Tax=Shewanella electrica TaxID=515560 RepID=A0ABT2FID3_9GAMM|nr:YggN family protein [Shewanella electrica]MCH1925179.1 YggN family protein [Shewanella electrica]MCS4555004.1 YggN family protein [Shewanella electrica]